MQLTTDLYLIIQGRTKCAGFWSVIWDKSHEMANALCRKHKK